MKIRSLHAGELDALNDLVAVSYAKKGTDQAALRASFKEVMKSDQDFNLDANRVIAIDGRLVARIGIYDRRMFFEGKLLRVGAIGGVCTAPEFRGRGLARTLLEDCTNYMRENGFDLSLLFGEPAIYGKSGWQTLSSFSVTTNFKVQTPAGFTSVTRPADISADMESLVRMHGLTSARLNGPFQRPEKYWRTWITRKVQASNIFKPMLVTQENQPVGYYVIKGNTEICELGWDVKRAETFETLAHAIWGNWPDASIRFSFVLSQLFDFIARNSISPTLDEMRRQQYGISKEALYCGLFKLIGNIPGIRDTEQLIHRLRAANYVFWDLDHF